MGSRQQQLPLGKAEYYQRCRAIEEMTSGATGLTPIRLERVKFFLLFIFKHRKSSFDGTMTFVRVRKAPPGLLSISGEMRRSKRTVDDWISWATQAELVDTSIDCDSRGYRRTTLVIRWNRILQMAENEGQLVENQSAVSADQSAVSADQSAVSTDQSAVSALSHIPITNNQPPRTDGAVAVVEQEVSVLDGIAEELVRAGVHRANTMTVELAHKGHNRSTVAEIVDTYLANQERFRGPGAVVDRLRTGHWPVDGIVEAGELRQRQEAHRRRQNANKALADLWGRIRKLRIQYAKSGGNGDPTAFDSEIADQLIAEGFSRELVNDQFNC